MPIRVAFIGKGGTGKSVISGMFARFLARSGESVLALDSDPMPGMSFSLGLGNLDLPIPDEAVSEQPEGTDGPHFRLREDLDALSAMELYSSIAPDGVRYLQFGKLGAHVKWLSRSQAAFQQIVAELPKEAYSMIGDLPGGTRQPFFGWARFADHLLIVVEPTSKSILSAKRLMRLTTDQSGPSQILAVVNKTQHLGDVEVVRSKTGLEVIGVIPLDAGVAEADRRGISPMDYAPYSPAVLAVEALTQTMRLAAEEGLSSKLKSG